MEQVIGVSLSLYVLVSYWLIGKRGTRQFDIANAIAMIPSAWLSWQLGAYHAVIISISFGAVALVRILKNDY